MLAANVHIGILVVRVAALAVGLTSVDALAEEKAKPALGDITGKALQKEVVIRTTPEELWRIWTTSDGIASFFSPDSNLGREPGDPFELFMGMQPDESGLRGSEGCKLLCSIPHEMLAFEWSFPPKVMSLRIAKAKTFIVLRFQPLGDGQVRVRFAQAGWENGSDWRAGWKYFDQAWSFVLDNLKKTLEAKPASAMTAQPEPKRWTDGHVAVTSVEGADRSQTFEMTVPVSADRLYQLLGSSAGLAELGGKDPVVELRPWGRYSFWPGAPNKVLAFLENEVLAVSGSAPPEFPNVRKGGTWSSYFFEPVAPEQTRVRLVCVGWKQGDEWDRAFAYFLKNNPIFLNHAYEKAVSGAKRADASAARDNPQVFRKAADAATPAGRLACLAPMIGTWESTSTEKDGGTFVARAAYEWGLGGKTVNARSYVVQNGEPKLVYETQFGWNPTTQSVVYRSFSAWDAMYEGTVTGSDRILTFEWTGHAADQITLYRQTIEMKGDDSYEWTVYQQNGGKWDKTKQTTFHRLSRP